VKVGTIKAVKIAVKFNAAHLIIDFSLFDDMSWQGGRLAAGQAKLVQLSRGEWLQPWRTDSKKFIHG